MARGLRRSCRAQQGFTLIEVLIVVVVIAILAAIVVPRILGAGREAREGQLRGNLHALRTSIALFQAHTGEYPATLDDLLKADATGMVGASGSPIVPSLFRGPYFSPLPTIALPTDPMTGAADWLYTPNLGGVHSSSAWTSTDGTDYSAW